MSVIANYDVFPHKDFMLHSELEHVFNVTKKYNMVYTNKILATLPILKQITFSADMPCCICKQICTRHLKRERRTKLKKSIFEPQK